MSTKANARIEKLNLIMGCTGRKAPSQAETVVFAENCVEDTCPDIATASDEDFDHFAAQLANYWPSYMAYHREQEGA